METTMKRPSIFWPLLLIALGVAFLLANFGYIQLDFWYMLSKLWPAVFILGSLDSLWKGEEFAGSLVMLAFGSLLLAASLGYLTFGPFELLIRLWPVFIISLALNIIFGRAPIWAALIGGLVAIALIAGVFWYSEIVTWPSPAGGGETISQDLEGANRANVQLDLDVADLSVSAGSTGAQLASAHMDLRSGQQAEQEYEVSGDTGSYTLRSSDTTVRWPVIGFGRQYSWTVDLNRDVPMDLDTHVAVGDLTVDLTGLQVSSLDVRADVGTVDVTLPAEGELEGRIRSAVGATILRVPEGVALQVEVDTGITGMSIPDDYVRHGSLILSPEADAGGASMRLRLDQPIGSIEIISD